MNFKKNILILIQLLLFGKIGFTQNNTNDDYVKAEIRYENYVYKPNIKTVQLHSESHEISQPIINLDAQEKLKFSFDELDANIKNYSYTFIHCNSEWKPSNLLSNEYIDGFQSNLIEDFNFSINTIQKYVHYNVVFPNDYTKIILSGNYILKIFLNGNPDDIIITRRFMVFQNRVGIDATISRASDQTYNNYSQEIDFVIRYSDYNITNPYSDLKIVITQNNRWDNAKRDLQPLFVKDGELTYNLMRENVFPGGSEFRNINITSIRFKSDRIIKIITDSSIYHIIIYPDEKRSFKNYEYLTDINGNFLIKNQEGTNSETEADYCIVHFFVPLDDPALDGNIYILGAYNGWQLNTENLLHYNDKRKGYEVNLLLKQGYYNYKYVFLKDGSTEADETFIEGNHYETENNYTIYVYHTQRGTNFEQLIGLKQINSAR